METFSITETQGSYLSELARIASKYRSTLEDVQRYAARELVYLDGGNFDSGRHHQLLGELAIHKQELATHLDAQRYVLMDLEPEERTRLLQLAVKGEQTWFFPANLAAGN